VRVSVNPVGFAAASRKLSEAGRKIDPALRGALNTTATKTRSERFVKPLRTTIKGKRLRSALKVKRANSRRMESRIIPSSSGVPVPQYAKWGYDAIDATRARIWVMSPSGKKIAAGFVNPSSTGRKPLISRTSRQGRSAAYTYNKKLQEAIGPSAAFWFKQLADLGTIRWTNAFLQKEFQRRIIKELNKP
jgi:hypothetical protein